MNCRELSLTASLTTAATGTAPTLPTLRDEGEEDEGEDTDGGGAVGRDLGGDGGIVPNR